VTQQRISTLARELPVDLRSRGVCPACLLFVISELHTGDGRKIGGAVTRIASTLWDEGLDASVRFALEHAVRRDLPGAAEALRDFELRGFRSAIFRAVVRRLAEDLDEEARRHYLASLN
jgi:hypothetical protein